MKEMNLTQIGKISSAEDGFSIVLEKKYADALTETEGFSHLIVLWWAHHFDIADYREITVTEKPYTKGPEKIGIFATRSQIRPNPVAVSVVQVIKVDRDSGTVYVPYIDAEVNTPVIDIKPYHPCSDIVESVSVPDWCDHWPKSIEQSASFNWGEEFNFPE